jgi:hypothetical protein
MFPYSDEYELHAFGLFNDVISTVVAIPAFCMGG